MKKYLAVAILVALAALAACSGGQDGDLDALSVEAPNITRVQLTEDGQGPAADYLIVVITAGQPVTLVDGGTMHFSAAAGALAGDLLTLESGGQVVALSIGPDVPLPEEPSE